MSAEDLYRVDLCTGMDHRLSAHSAAYINAGAGPRVIVESRRKRGCIVADYAIHHAVPCRRDCLQHLLRKTTPADGRYLHGRSRCWFLRLCHCPVGY